MASRGLRSAAELAADRPHGNRLRYIAGCRCQDCRLANTEYEKQRARARKEGDWNGLVPAQQARQHMAMLSAKGIGRRTVRDITGVSNTILCAIIAGRKTTIRARTQKLILGITEAAAPDSALVPAGPSWALIEELLADGYTKAALARAMGSASGKLQLCRDRITVRNAYEVARVHERLRKCDADRSLEILALLRAEGYRPARIKPELAALAAAAGLPEPDITVRNNRIRADAARLLERLYQKLTE